VAAVEHSTTHVINDGQVDRPGLDVTFDAETVARMRLGYLCMRCWEPQEQSFPHACSLCGYGMAEFQLRDFTEEFLGEKHIGPSTTLDDELEMMRDRKARERHVGGSSIWVPDSAA
jgi:hypothetical protein